MRELLTINVGLTGGKVHMQGAWQSVQLKTFETKFVNFGDGGSLTVHLLVPAAVPRRLWWDGYCMQEP